MPIVTLQDGRKINFASMPTQADIDEVVSNLSQAKPVKKETDSLSLFRPKQLVESAKSAIKEEFGSAAQDIQKARERQSAGEQGSIRTGITTLAQGAQAGLGTAFRGVFGAASALLPDFIENPLRRKLGDVFDDFIESDTGKTLVSEIQKVSEKIDTLDPKNRQLVRDIGDTVMTGVDLASFGVGGKLARKELEKVGKKAGKKGLEILQKSERDEIENIRGKLADMIIDDTTPTKRSAIASRTTEGGFFSGRNIKPTATERKIVDELLTTTGIKANRSSLFNLNLVTESIKKEAESLTSVLKRDNFIAPKKEAIARLSSTLDNLKVTDTDIIGDAEQLADRIFAKMRVFIEDSEGTGLGFLEARKNFDAWVRAKKPKAFEKQDAFNSAVRSARNTVNDFLAEKATKTEVKKSLTRQSLLKRAEDVLKVKAGKEAATGFGRLLDKIMAVLGRKNQIVQILATIVGIGGLGAAAAFAPTVAVVGGVVGTGVGLIKLLNSPAGRKKLAQVLLLIEKSLPKAKGEQRAVLQELKDEINALLNKDVSIGLSIEDVTKSAPTKPFDDIAKEARKFKSAEEKVKDIHKVVSDYMGGEWTLADTKKLKPIEISPILRSMGREDLITSVSELATQGGTAFKKLDPIKIADDAFESVRRAGKETTPLNLLEEFNKQNLRLGDFAESLKLSPKYDGVLNIPIKISENLGNRFRGGKIEININNAVNGLDKNTLIHEATHALETLSEGITKEVGPVLAAARNRILDNPKEWSVPKIQKYIREHPYVKDGSITKVEADNLTSQLTDIWNKVHGIKKK